MFNQKKINMKEENEIDRIQAELADLEKEAEEMNNFRNFMRADIESEKDPVSRLSKKMAAGLVLAIMAGQLKENTARAAELTQRIELLKAEETTKAYLAKNGLMPKED